jgi:non-heme chloroperoxidase
MPRPGRPAGAALAVAAAAVVAGGVAAARRVDAAWSDADEDDHDDRLPPPGRSITVTTDDNAELAVRVSGPDDGPTAVLAHCWMGGPELWAPVAHRLLRRGWRVVLYDQRAHGSSTVGDEGLTIPRLGADLRAVLEAVDARDAVLAGHSMGGMTVQSLAAHHPEVVAERVRAIVLVATAASGLGRGRRADAVAQRVIGSRATERVLATSMGHALTRAAVGASVRRSHLVTTRDLVVACPPAAGAAGPRSSLVRSGLRSPFANFRVSS